MGVIFYTVTDRNITGRTTLEAIKAAGLARAADITVGAHHATTYKAGGPDAQPEAVAVYASEGSDFTGQRV